MSRITTGSDLPLALPKIIVSIGLALGVLVLSEDIGIWIGNKSIEYGGTTALANCITGIVFAVVGFMGVVFICKKILKVDLSSCYITRLSKTTIKPSWLGVSVILPVLVTLAMVAMPGHWVISPMEEDSKWAIISGATFFMGIGTGIVEETVYRGVIMGVVEARWGRKIAVIVPSIFFGIIHILARDIPLVEKVQVVIGLTLMAIVFSLITYATSSVWTGVVLHSLWNMVIIGGVVSVGPDIGEKEIYSYVLDTDFFLITGGDFGIEASVIAIGFYVVVAWVALGKIKRDKL